MRPQKRFFLALVLVLAIAGPAILQLATLQVQEGSTSSREQAAASPSAPKDAPKQTLNENGENAELKHSPGVEFIARKTGLTLNQSYWAVVFFNFAVVIGILWMLMRKALPVMFKARTQAIQKRMEPRAPRKSAYAIQRKKSAGGLCSRPNRRLPQQQTPRGANSSLTSPNSQWTWRKRRSRLSRAPTRLWYANSLRKSERMATNGGSSRPVCACL